MHTYTCTCMHTHTHACDQKQFQETGYMSACGQHVSVKKKQIHYHPDTPWSKVYPKIHSLNCICKHELYMMVYTTPNRMHGFFIRMLFIIIENLPGCHCVVTYISQQYRWEVVADSYIETP